MSLIKAIHCLYAYQSKTLSALHVMTTNITTPQTKVTLYQEGHFIPLWQRLLYPWLNRLNRDAWLLDKPAVILTPDSTHSMLVKEYALRHEMPLLGVHILTPGSIRERLAKYYPTDRTIASAQDLQLLATYAAKPQQPTGPFASFSRGYLSVFLQSFAQLEQAGWGTLKLHDQPFQSLAQKLHTLLQTAKLASPACFDRLLANQTTSQPTTLGPVFIFGFSGAHWPYWSLLRAVIAAANNVIFTLPTPSPAIADILWQSSWEGLFGEIHSLPSVEPQSSNKAFITLAQHFDYREHGGTAPPYAITYTLADNAAQEAAIIAEIAQAALLDHPNPRIAIVCSGNTPLAREIAICLAKNNTCFHDSIGHKMGNIAILPQVKSWLSLQQEFSLKHLLGFLRALHKEQLLASDSYHIIERELQLAFRDTQSDDIAVLQAYSQETHKKHFSAILADWPCLPAQTTLAEFYTATHNAFTKLHCPQDLSYWHQRLQQLAQAITTPIDRPSFLEWLTQSFTSSPKGYHPMGTHPFAQIHLIRDLQAYLQPWTTLIIAGMNKGSWPANIPNYPAIDKARIAKINNHLVHTTDHSYHWHDPQNHSYLLTDTDQLHLQKARLSQLIEHTEEAIQVTASLHEPQNCFTTATLSDFLLQLHWADTGHSLDAQQLHQYFRPQPKPQKCSTIDQTKIAYQRRRDPTTPFGEYDFSLAHPPDHPLELTCKDWEQTLEQPAAIWFKVILQAQPLWQPYTKELIAATRGTWVHDWLCWPPTTLSHPVPSPEAWETSINQRATTLLSRLTTAYAAANRSIPDWLACEWQQSLDYAKQLMQAVTAQTSGHHMAQEIPLPPDFTLSLPNGITLPIRGRIDLLLSATPINWATARDRDNLWVVDFKTGKPARKLSRKTIANGVGLQTLLYAMACQQLQSTEVALSLLYPEMPLQPQLTTATAPDLRPLWQRLSTIATAGFFGLKPNKSASQRQTSGFPLAFIPIPANVLQKKEQLTQAQHVPIES